MIENFFINFVIIEMLSFTFVKSKQEREKRECCKDKEINRRDIFGDFDCGFDDEAKVLLEGTLRLGN